MRGKIRLLVGRPWYHGGLRKDVKGGDKDGIGREITCRRIKK